MDIKMNKTTSTCGTHPLLRQLVTATHLADLVGLVVPAGGAVTTVVLPLASHAVTTTFSLFLDGFLWRVVLWWWWLLGRGWPEAALGAGHVHGGAQSCRRVVGGVSTIGGGGRDAGDLAAVLRPGHRRVTLRTLQGSSTTRPLDTGARRIHSQLGGAALVALLLLLTGGGVGAAAATAATRAARGSRGRVGGR